MWNSSMAPVQKSSLAFGFLAITNKFLRDGHVELDMDVDRKYPYTLYTKHCSCIKSYSHSDYADSSSSI
jgi:hypothetical protein